jgi:hypothetical protein
MHDSFWNRLRGAKWTLPASAVQPGLQYCIVATDAARNASKPFCDKIAIAH